MAYVNEGSLGVVSRARAGAGIVAPIHWVILPGTILYRFGRTSGLALRGCWWLDAFEFHSIAQWAASSGLTLAHAVRIRCAVAHDWSDMRYMVKARVTAPLCGYRGQSALQRTRGEYLNPTPSDVLSATRQLYIPGLDNPTVNAAAVTRLSMRLFAVGTSHIFGVPGVPANAVRH